MIPSHSRCLLRSAFGLALIPLLAFPLRAGFTVRRNLHDAKPREAALILFQKGKDASHLLLEANGETTAIAVEPEGPLVVTVTGNAEANPRISWTPGPGRPETLDAAGLSGVMIRYRFVGDQVRTHENGKSNTLKVTNPWLVFMLLNDKGERTDALNLAYLQPDHALPTEMTEQFIPMNLLTDEAFNDTTRLRSVSLKLPPTHANLNRNFRIEIESIVFTK